LVLTVAKLNATKKVSENPENLTEFGLDTPNGNISIITKSGEKTTINIGKATAFGDEYYVKKDGENTIYTVGKTNCELFMQTESYFRDLNMFSINLEDIKYCDIISPNKASLNIREKTEEEMTQNNIYNWIMTSPYKKDVNSQPLTEDFINKIPEISATGIVDKSRENELFPIGNTTTIKFGNAENKIELTIGKETQDGIATKVLGENTIYLVPKEQLDFVNIDPYLLIDKLIHLVNIDTVKEVNLKAGSDTYAFEVAKGEEEKTYRCKLNGNDMNEENFKKVYQELLGLTIFDFNKATSNGEVILEYTFKYNNGKPDDNVKFTANSDRTYAVTKNGVTECTAEKTAVDAAIGRIKELIK
ncbi:MAG: DUF4340 domain-containing protein, partial [Oscillospiraceae bacterium]